MLALAIASLCAPAPAAVHSLRAAQIERTNAVATTWKAAAHPRFASEPPGVSANSLGVLRGWREELDDALARGTLREFLPTEDPVPQTFDAAEAFPMCAKVISDIRDQGNCGCCWAVASASALSDRLCIATNASVMVPLSAQDMCFNAKQLGCNGAYSTLPMKYWLQSGLVTGGQYNGSGPFGGGYCADYTLPHCHHHGPTKGDPYPSGAACPTQPSPPGPTACGPESTRTFATDKYTSDGFGYIARGPTAIRQFMMAGGPCYVTFDVYPDFEDYESGIYTLTNTSERMLGSHAVRMVGWGVDGGVHYWKVANSWNRYWGEGGYFRIGIHQVHIDSQCIATAPNANFTRK